MRHEYLRGVLITESRTNPETGEPFTEEERLRHARLGVLTELGELLDIWKKHIYYGKDISIPHLIEEIGDCYWYIGLGFNVIGIIAADPELVPVALDDPIDVLENAMYTVANAGFNMEHRLMYAYRSVSTLMKLQGLDYDGILSKNLAKLAKRYGPSFDADRAVNRDLSAEAEAMEDA